MTQRAFVAERALPEFEAEAKERQRAAGGALPEKIPGAVDARDVAARTFDVNPRYVSDAKRNEW